MCMSIVIVTAIYFYLIPISIGEYDGEMYSVSDEWKPTTSSGSATCMKCTCKSVQDGGVVCQDMSKQCDLTCDVSMQQLRLSRSAYTILYVVC